MTEKTIRPVPSVRAVISDRDGRVLLLRRAAGTVAGGKWCLPGGKVEYGSTVEDAVRREVLEETGLVTSSVRFLFYQDSLPTEPGGMHCINLYFACEVDGTVALNSESSEYAWVGRTEISRFCIVFRNVEALQQYWGE